MTFKERLHPKVSNAEHQLFTELSRADLTAGMTTQELIVLKGTYPDFQWKEKKLAVYVDGPPHLKGRVSDKDELIDNLLELLGWNVLRLAYKSPVSKKTMDEWVRLIRMELGKTEASDVPVTC